MNWKTAKKCWKAGVVLFYLISYLNSIMGDMFLHTDRLPAYLAGMVFMLYLPDFIRREVDRKKGNILIGVFLFLLLFSMGLSKVMLDRYGTEEVLMPIYGEYMLNNGEKDVVLISTREWNFRPRYQNYQNYKGGGKTSPEYIYLMKKGFGAEKNILRLLERRYGPGVMLDGFIVNKGDEELGTYYVEERGEFDIITFMNFDNCPIINVLP